MSDVNSLSSPEAVEAVEAVEGQDAHEPRSPHASSTSEIGSVHVMVGSQRTRIVLSGEIDAALGAELQDAATDAETAGRPVEIDARRVLFMDSSGVTLLARLASRTPGRLTVIGPPDVVRFLLEVTHIGDLIDIVDRDPGFDEGPPGDDPPQGVA